MTAAADSPGLPEAGYVLATPARNELAALPGLIATMEAQRAKPLVWLIVDDGSDDGSRQWLEQAAARIDWLSVVPAPEAANEYLGAHIARLKRFGMEQAIARARAMGLRPACAGILDIVGPRPRALVRRALSARGFAAGSDAVLSRRMPGGDGRMATLAQLRLDRQRQGASTGL